MQYNADSTKQILKRLLSNHVKPYWAHILLSVFFMIIVAVCVAAIVRLVEPAVNDVFLSHDQKMLVILPLVMIGVYFIKGLAEYFQSYLIKWVGQRILTDLQMQMYRHLLFADLTFIQSQSSGRLISRFTNDISLMRGAVSNLLIGCAKHFLSVVFLIVVMFQLEPALSVVVFLAFPAAIYPVQRLGRRLRKVSCKVQEELGHYTARLDETFHSIKIIKSFLGEKLEIRRVEKITQNILTFYKKSASLDALTSPIMESLSGIAIGGVVWYGGHLIISGKTTPGALFAFSTAFVSAYRPFKSLLALNVNLQEGLAAAKRVFAVLDMKPAIKEEPQYPDVEFDNPEIVFNNVELKFNEKIALNSLYLKLAPGKTTMIVGRSGSGKTSVANLLERFYDPTNGSILINDHDIKKIKLSSLRRQIAFVPQETILFDSTVAENIAYGIESAILEDIIEAAKFADAHEFISNLPQGYETMIGTQGCSLSGGQRQKLAIARAFLKNAEILVLDEATSNLDTNSEHHILESIANLRHRKTTLIITHRLANVTIADNVIVMKSGSIVEQGTHEDLLQSKGEYYKLYSREKHKEK